MKQEAWLNFHERDFYFLQEADYFDQNSSLDPIESECKYCEKIVDLLLNYADLLVEALQFAQ